ncbi:MAG: SGNH/GDSL hydrolase family protein, partial [Candidatus Hydromicrobium sp.]
SEVFLSDANGGYLWAGETINIKIIIRNSGEKEAASYRLICHIPAGAAYISGSGTPEGISWSDEIRGLIWNLNNLNVGSEKEINLQIRVNDDLLYTGGNIVTNFKIESNGSETEIEQASLNVKKHIYMTIVAMGDSLIARSDWVQRFDQLLELTFPYADYNTIASGVSGEKAYEGYARFDSTVAIYRPQIIIITYGTNDTGAGLTNFSVHLEGLIMKSRNLGATVFLNLIGPVFYSGKESYPQYNNEILKIAAKYSLPVIDVLSPLSQNPDRYLYDGVHYTTDGSAVVAQTVFNYVIQYLDDFGQRR